jgi:hypothetical protein
MRAAGIAFVLFVIPAAADDKPAKTERFTYRVTGLFAPDRVEDLRAAFTEIPGITLLSIDYEEAEMTVAFAPAKAFPGSKPEQWVERVNDRVRAASGHTFGVKPRRTVPREKLQSMTIPVAGLDCKACCLAAYEAVAAIDGVERATASFKDGKVTALIDPRRTERAKLEEALRKRGVSLPGRK